MNPSVLYLTIQNKADDLLLFSHNCKSNLGGTASDFSALHLKLTASSFDHLKVPYLDTL